jgi:hypothetical protein
VSGADGGRGACFVLDLPAVPESVPADVAAAAPIGSPGSDGGQTGVRLGSDRGQTTVGSN